MGRDELVRKMLDKAAGRPDALAQISRSQTARIDQLLDENGRLRAEPAVGQAESSDPSP